MDFRRRPFFPLSFASRRSFEGARVRRVLVETRRATEAFITILIVIGIPLLLERRGDRLRRRHFDRHPAGPVSRRRASHGARPIRRDGFHRT